MSVRNGWGGLGAVLLLVVVVGGVGGGQAGVAAGAERAATGPIGLDAGKGGRPGGAPGQVGQVPPGVGLTPEQIRQKLREAGVPEGAIESYDQEPSPAAPEPGEGGDREEDKKRAPRPEGVGSRALPGQEPFGAEIFRYSPTTFEPLAFGPAGPDYVIGPGDELVLAVWGDDQISLALPVSREGLITLPEAGQVQVGGLTLDGVRARLQTVLSRIYSGMRTRDRRATTFMNVSLGKTRSIQVFILGYVVRPGGYTVSSVSRVLNALYAAGGPSRPGSMREIRVMRGGQAVATVDLYDLILRGDTSKEVRLENGDVIFVLPAGKRVVLTGPVRRQGLFELKPGEHLRALLEMAGGPLATADLSRAQIDRVIPPALRDSLQGQDRIAIDVPLSDVLARPRRDVALSDADRITVFPVGNVRVNTVTIHGDAVVKPGVYEFKPGMHLKDLVQRAGGLAPDALLDRAQVTRTAPDLTRSLIRLNLGGALAGREGDNLELQALDEVTIVSRWDMRQRGHVDINGMVRHPGGFELLEGMTLADLVFAAGGLSEDAFPLRAEISRVDSLSPGDSARADTISVALPRDLTALPEAGSFRLRNRDAVFIRRDPTYREQLYVTISGEVRFPGIYALVRRDERITDLVRRAGGLTDLAYPRAAVFTRAKSGRVNLDLPDALRDEQNGCNLALEPGDELRVPRYQPTVSVEGAVRNPGTTLYRPGEGIGYYITQASGFQHDADRRGLVVVMANGDVRRRAVPDPGSRIVVPTRPDSSASEALKEVASMLSIVASTVTTLFIIQRAVR